MNKLFTRWILPALKLILAGAVMVWMFKGGKLDWGLILEGALAPSVVLMGIGCNLFLISSAAVRWYLLLKGQGTSFPFKFAHYLTYVTSFFNLLIPGGVGGDALRLAFVLKQPAARKGQAALTVILDRFLGLYTMLLIAAAFSLILLDHILASPPLTLLTFSTFLLVVGGPPAALFILWLMRRSHQRPNWLKGRPGGRLERIFQLATEFAIFFNSSKKMVVASILVSIVGQLVGICSMLWIAHNLEIPIVPIENVFLAAPWAWIANILPISPGGLGVGEAAFDQVCQWLSSAPLMAAFGTVFLINRLFLLLATLPGLLFFLFRSRWNPDKKNILPTDSEAINHGVHKFVEP
ncbi:MAG: hypothetical protein HW380_2700 [Magnetococcales bacterium]|nr:hypothetical protein [Magnetococcales bacterium]HIJ83222.1 flippase-like domain-containing protein [Magnetococcales bacterium]